MIALDVSISPQRKKLLRRFADGKTDKQIAREFGCRAALIAAQRQFMIDRLKISSQAELAVVAIELASWPGWQPQGRCRRDHQR
ncbi:LuxR C-terminal-related transcriptional regulator [Bradyrhizobium sp. RT6a]